MYCATNLQLICSMTTYPHLNTIPGHMLHYGVCTNEPFQFTEIQSANSAIENSLYSRRKSTAWPAVLIEDGIDNTNEIGMQEDIIVIKTEANLDSERYLMDSPLPDCIISPDQSPGMETSDISQSQNFQVSSTQCSSHKAKNKNVWGDMSYADLITKAIISSQNQRMTLAEIYAWIVDNVSYFADKKDTSSTSGWKNSIRHNLSLHNKFKRVPNETSGKSSWWTINPDKTGTKTRRGPNTSSSPRPSTPKLGRKEIGKETPTLKRKERKKSRSRRGSEGTISLSNMDLSPHSPLMSGIVLTRTNSSDVYSGDSQTSTPMTSPIMKQRSGSFGNMLSPRLGTSLATTTTWNSNNHNEIPLIFGSSSPKCRLRSHSHPAESTLIHTISPNIRKSSESRPNCAHSLGLQTPDSIADMSHCSSNIQAPWTSPITSPSPISNHPIALQLSDQRSRSSSLTVNRSPPFIGISEPVKPHYYHPPIVPRERAHSFTATHHSMHYEPLQAYQEQTQELHPFQIQLPSYSEYKRTSVLHTFSDPYGTLSTCNSTVVQHTNPPLSAGPPQSQFMLTRPKTFFSDYEIEHKILDTQHPRVQDIKRESVGELPTSSSSSCFQLNPYQRSYQQQTNCPITIVKEEKMLNFKNASCSHADINTANQPQIDLNSLQPTLLSDQISINAIEKDVSFEMFDNKLRIQTVPIV